MDLSGWWQAMEFAEKLFWGIAIPSSLLLVAQLFMSFLGGELDDVELEADADGMAGWQVLSYKNILGFLTVFAWIGLGVQSMGWGTWLAVALGSVAGLMTMLAMAFLWMQMARMQETGNMRMENALFKTAEVYLTVPAERKGMGKVNVNIQGAIRELDALTDDGQDIPTGGQVHILEIVDEQYVLVTKYNA